MSTEFTREDRYIVFKLSDVERYLTDADRAHLAMMKNEIDAGRDCANKPPFKGLIVESDWPEYEPTWKAIEARVTGAQPAPTTLAGARKVTRDFRWDAATQCHVPTLKVEFEPVHIDEPSDAKGWQDQDRIAVMLEAAPGAQPAPSVPVDVITDYLVSISAHVAHQDDLKAQAEIGELLRMLAAAPEAKP